MSVIMLTTRTVETAKAVASRVEIRDAKVEGLELRITPAGSKSWALRYRRKSDGAKRIITLGHYPEMDLGEARDCASEARRTVAKGGDPAAGVQERKYAPTFREVVKDWQELHAAFNRSERVRKDDAAMLDRYVLPILGDIKAVELTRRDLSRMLNEAKLATDGRVGHVKKGNEPRRLTTRPNRVFQLARAIIRWAVEQGTMTSDPTLGMKKPIKKEAARERELSWAEIARFWSGLDGLTITSGLRIALRLALVTAQRIDEVCGIAKSELMLDDLAPVWSLPGGRAKNDEGVRVPLSPLAVKLMREAWALSGTSSWLFPSRTKDGPIQGHAATVATFRGRAKLGLENFRVHDLRRTAATRMGEMGINPHTISLILNHVSASKSTITSRVYMRYQFDAEKRDALARWGRRLEQIIAGLEGQNVVSTGIAAECSIRAPRDDAH
jgi:integrase